MDSIGEIGFGVHLNTLESDTVPFAFAFDEVQRLGFGRSLNVLAQIMHQFLGVSWSSYAQYIFPEEREIQEHLKTLHDFSLSVISDRRDNPPSESSQDLLSLFMLEGKAASDGSNSQIFDDSFLKDIVSNNLIPSTYQYLPFVSI